MYSKEWRVQLPILAFNWLDTKIEVSIEHIPRANVYGIECYNYSFSADSATCTQGLIASIKAIVHIGIIQRGHSNSSTSWNFTLTTVLRATISNTQPESRIQNGTKAWLYLINNSSCDDLFNSHSNLPTTEILFRMQSYCGIRLSYGCPLKVSQLRGHLNAIINSVPLLTF